MLTEDGEAIRLYANHRYDVGRFPTAFDSSAAKTTAFTTGNLHSAYQRNERTLAGVQAENNESKKPSAPYRLSILIADDEVDMALTLAEILRDEGHIVHTTASAN